MATDIIARGLALGAKKSAINLPTYNATQNYAKDDLVIYNGKIYKAKQDITAEPWNPAHWEESSLGKVLSGKVDLKYNDTLQIVKLTDLTITMGAIGLQLDSINAKGDHVMFDTSAFNVSMYLVTIYSSNGFYRVCDMVTGFEKTGFYKATDLLLDILKGASSSGHHYTVKWDKVNAQCERLNDAASITTTTTNFGHFGSVNPNYDNPFDEIYPWSGRKLCNIDIDAYYDLEAGQDITECVKAWEDDANFDYEDANGVWVYTPAFFGRTFEAGNYRYFDITDELNQYNVSYPAMITGRWFGVSTTLTVKGTSKTCFVPLGNGAPHTDVSGVTLHTNAKNYKAQLTDIYQVDASTLLMVVEFASLNSQTKIGNGVSDLYRQLSDLIQAASSTNEIKILKSANANVIVGAKMDIGTSDGGSNVGQFRVVSIADDPNDTTLSIVTLDKAGTFTTSHYWSIHGKCNTLDSEIGSKSGYIGTNGKSIAYYRGEEMWGNMFKYVLGAYRQTGTGHIWIAERGDCDNYDDLDTTKHIDTNIVLPAEGYIKTLALCDGLSIPAFCSATGGTSTNPVGDYCYIPSLATANTVLRLGGYASDRAGDGAFSGRWNRAAYHSNWLFAACPSLKTP